MAVLVIEFLQIGLAIVLLAIVYWIIDFFMLGEEAPTPNPVDDLIIPEYGPLYDEERLGIEQ